MGGADQFYVLKSVDTDGELAWAQTLQRIMTSVGALVGPLLAPYLIVFGFRYCMIIVALTYIGNSIIGWIFFSSFAPEAKEEDSDGSSEKSSWDFLDTRVFLFLAISMGFTGSLNFIAGMEPVYLKEHFGFTAVEFGYYTEAGLVGTLLFMTISAQVVEKLQGAFSIVTGCIGGATFTLLQVFFRYPWIPYLSNGVLVGVATNLFGMGQMILLKRKIPGRHIGAINAVSGSLCSGMATLCPFIGGTTYEIFWPSPFFLAAGTQLLCVPLLLFMASTRDISSTEEAKDEKRAKNIADGKMKANPTMAVLQSLPGGFFFGNVTWQNAALRVDEDLHQSVKESILKLKPPMQGIMPSLSVGLLPVGSDKPHARMPAPATMPAFS